MELVRVRGGTIDNVWRDEGNGGNFPKGPVGAALVEDLDESQP